MRLGAPKEFFSGLIFLLVGVAAFATSNLNYENGTATHMGPGYFPALISILLILFGLGSLVRGVVAVDDAPVEKLSIQPLFLILAGVMGFALTLERFGLVVSIFILLFFACFRRMVTHPLDFLITYVVLTIFSVGVFVYGFGVTIPVFWWS